MKIEGREDQDRDERMKIRQKSNEDEINTFRRVPILLAIFSRPFHLHLTKRFERLL